MEDKTPDDGYTSQDFGDTTKDFVDTTKDFGETNQDFPQSKIEDNVSPLEIGENKYPPDKGRAWLVALMGMLLTSVTFGAFGGYGVFLTYYINNEVYPGSTTRDYAFIAGIAFCLGQIFSPLVAIASDLIGARWLILAGLVLHTAGYVLASFTTEIWQLYICQGVMPGLAIALVFLTITLVLPTYFDKWLSLSMGCVASGAGFGGIISTLYVNSLINSTGNAKWSLRVMGIIGGVVLLMSFIIFVPNRKIKYGFKRNVRRQFNLSIFKLYPLSILAIWFGMTYMAYIILLFTLAPYARNLGLTSTQGTHITLILNVGQTVGRPFMGFLGDRFGRYNITTIYTLIIIILIFAFWINARTYPSLMAFGMLVGLLVGVTPTMGQSLAHNILRDDKKLPAAWSGLNISSGLFTLFAEVIALEVVDNSLSRPYIYTQIFAGASYFAAFVMLLVIREWIVRREMQESDEKSRYRYTSNSITDILIRMFYPIKV